MLGLGIMEAWAALGGIFAGYHNWLENVTSRVEESKLESTRVYAGIGQPRLTEFHAS